MKKLINFLTHVSDKLKIVSSLKNMISQRDKRIARQNKDIKILSDKVIKLDKIARKMQGEIEHYKEDQILKEQQLLDKERLIARLKAI